MVNAICLVTKHGVDFSDVSVSVNILLGSNYSHGLVVDDWCGMSLSSKMSHSDWHEKEVDVRKGGSRASLLLLDLI